MPFPNTTFRTELEPTNRKEVDALCALLREYLGNEHESDGTHGHITAESITLGGTDPTFTFTLTLGDGTVIEVGSLSLEDLGVIVGLTGTKVALTLDTGTADAFMVRTPSGSVQIGLPGAGGGTFPIGPSVAFVDPAHLLDWSIGPSTDPATFNGQPQLSIADRTHGVDVLSLFRGSFYSDNTKYTLAPVLNAATPIYLGYRGDARYRFEEVAANLLYGQNGVQERGRTVALGEFQTVPFSAANFVAVGGGTWTMDAAAIIRNRYTLVGKTLVWRLYLAWFAGTNVIAGTVSSVTVTLPGVTFDGGQLFTNLYGQDAGGRRDIDASATGSGGAVSFTRRDGANFAAGPLGLVFTLPLEIT